MEYIQVVMKRAIAFCFLVLRHQLLFRRSDLAPGARELAIVLYFNTTVVGSKWFEAAHVQFAVTSDLFGNVTNVTLPSLTVVGSNFERMLPVMLIKVNAVESTASSTLKLDMTTILGFIITRCRRKA